MEKKIVGLSLVFFGLGMLAAKFFPWWSVVVAIIFIVMGIVMLKKH